MQPRHRGLGLAISCAALGLTACTTPTALSHSAIGYNAAIADAADSQLLLNIMRAAYRNPTHYTAVSQMRDSRTASGTASITGAFPFGPDATYGNSLSPSLSTTGTLSPSFDVAPLDKRADAEGLFHPVDPKIFITYWQQGWPKMLLLFLFVDNAKISYNISSHCRVPRYVDDAAYNEKAFTNARTLFKCIFRKLAFVRTSTTTQYLKDAAVSPDTVLKTLPELEKDGFDVTEHERDHKKLYSVSKTSSSWALRLGRIRLSTKNGSLIMAGGGESLTLRMRSVDGMVYYLGELVRLQKKRGRNLQYDGKYGPETLFQVKTNSSGGPDQNIAVEFLGNRYSVSRTPSRHDRSLTVLSLLTQVFALYRQEKELPKTEAVQIVGTR